MKESVVFRCAERKDVPLILQFIKELADYEKLLDEVTADEETLKEWIFDRQKAEVIFAVADGTEVGFALFFHNFSTFLGRAGIYLEDLFVRPEYRGKGYGKAILEKLAAIAVERKCGRLEWWCLDWNQPSIDFYLSLGAEPMSDWTVYRILGDTLKELAGESAGKRKEATQALRDAADYWDVKDADSIKLDQEQLKEMAEKYIVNNNTCALATGIGDYVRCTPIEYSYHDGCFWMFSEGGKKFIGLSENSNVSLAIYDKYEGFENLHGIQVTGRAELVEPFSEDYLSHAEYKNLSAEFLRKMKNPMHLIRVRPTRIDCLFSEFRKMGCAVRQMLVLDGGITENKIENQKK